MPSFCVFHPIWVHGAGGLKGSRAQPAFAVFQPRQLKMEVFETDFFDTLTIQSDQISYIKHGLAFFMCSSPYLVVGCSGGGGGGRGLPGDPGHNLLMQFPSLRSSKMELSETDFFDSLTIQNDQNILCKAWFSPSSCVFHPILVFGGSRRGGGGLTRGPGHNLLLQFPRLGSSKMELSETDFVDSLSIQNDEISYTRHGLAPLYVFFTLCGCRGGGGGGLPRGPRHNVLRWFFNLGSSQIELSETDFFDIQTTQNDQISCMKHVFGPSLCVF